MRCSFNSTPNESRLMMTTSRVKRRGKLKRRKLVQGRNQLSIASYTSILELITKTRTWGCSYTKRWICTPITKWVPTCMQTTLLVTPWTSTTSMELWRRHLREESRSQSIRFTSDRRTSWISLLKPNSNLSILWEVIPTRLFCLRSELRRYPNYNLKLLVIILSH